MFVQIATLLIDTVVAFLVFLLLARFHFQWLRVPFRNPMGEFVLAVTNWAVVPARRVIPGLAGLDLATLILAWASQALGLWAQAAIVGAEPSAVALVAVAAVDLLRYSVYILVFAVFVQVAISWINPDAPLGPLFDMVTRPFLRPLRRYVPPVGRVDLSPLVLLLVLYILLIPIAHLRAAAAGL
ncbi:MAG TPA: YggT family protein [Burkholderiales bacterium]|jgi:YggT family protein|nr:YggT family protein [Burkholderiales bacterium]